MKTVWCVRRKIVKLYDLIKGLLDDNELYRNSDRELIWRVLELEGTAVNGVITKDKFMHSKSTETIRRTRQKVQENHPELQPNSFTKNLRNNIQKQKGTHVYRVEIGADNIARRIYE